MLQNSGCQQCQRYPLTLHANVGTKASFGDDITVAALVVTLLDTSKLESNAIGDDGRVTVSNVGERTGVNKDGCALEGLHEGGLDGVLHEDGHGTSTANVLSGDGLTSLAGRDNHAAETEVSSIGIQ